MKKYFITGATGLVGGSLVKHLIGSGEQVIAYVRDVQKARNTLPQHHNLSIIEGSLEDLTSYAGEIDYIIHAAAPTGSSFFIEKPVETIDSIVMGTRAILELAKKREVKSVVVLSSMEVYGAPTGDELLTEDKQYYLDPLSLRSSYPMSKRLTETMCAAYASEYNVPVKVARLAQVLGNELLPDDNRVIAQFIRAAKEGIDIKIATDGKTKQTYIYVNDAMSGISTILEKGEDGLAYNLGNDQTYCSILELATMIAGEVANNEIRVITNTAPNAKKYPPNRTLRLSSAKLERLGWRAEVNLKQAVRKLIVG